MSPNLLQGRRTITRISSHNHNLPFFFLFQAKMPASTNHSSVFTSSLGLVGSTDQTRETADRISKRFDSAASQLSGSNITEEERHNRLFSIYTGCQKSLLEDSWRPLKDHAAFSRLKDVASDPGHGLTSERLAGLKDAMDGLLGNLERFNRPKELPPLLDQVLKGLVVTSEKSYAIVLEILDDLEKQCDEPTATVAISVGTSAAKEPRLRRHSKIALMVAQCRS